MSEETVVKEPEVKEPEVKVDPFEAQAREQHWVSKEEWIEQGKDEAEWRPAREFVERGEIFKSLHEVKRELKKERAARDALSRHHQFVFEKAYQQAVNDLKLQKRQAIRAEDFETAEVIEEEIEQLKETHIKEKNSLVQSQQVAEQGMPEFEAWVGKNAWYSTDQELRDFADAVGIVYANRNPGIRPDLVLAHVEKEVKSKFPNKFGTKRAAASPVASVDRTTKSTRESDIVLDDMETQIMNSLVSAGEMTASEYKAQLKKAKGIK